MSLASQSQINLDAGEIDRIIRDDEADREYIVEIVGDNDIRINHNERYAPDGTTLAAGQKHKIRRLRGKELYAAAFDGPTAIRVREAAADVESQPEKEVSILNASQLELAAAVGIQDSNGGSVDPASEQTVSSELPREVSTWNAGTLPVDVTTDPLGVTVNNSGDFRTPNPGSIQTLNLAVGTTTQQLPSITIPDELGITLKADVNNADEIFINGDFPLGPGEGVTLQVSNANVVSVASQSGTQSLYGIVEA